MPTKKVLKAACRNYNFFLIHSTASFDLIPSLGIQFEWLETAVEEALVGELFYLGQSSYLTSWGPHFSFLQLKVGHVSVREIVILEAGSLGEDRGTNEKPSSNETDIETKLIFWSDDIS